MKDREHGYQLHWTTPLYLAKVREHDVPYEVDVFGVSMLVCPQVMSPKYDWAGVYMIENLHEQLDGARVLEIGSGCGLVSVHALLRRAAYLVAADINPAAVENTRLNIERINALDRAAVVQSDMFDAVDGRFDLIIFNAPYHGCEAADLLERGVADPGYGSLRRFFANVRSFLVPGGEVLFGFSESGDLALAEALIREANLSTLQRLSDVREGYQCMIFRLRVAS